jgi:hypothetical protein
MSGPLDKRLAYWLDPNCGNGHCGQFGQRGLLLYLILGDVCLSAELTARVRIGTAAMAFFATILGLFVLHEHA